MRTSTVAVQTAPGYLAQTHVTRKRAARAHWPDSPRAPACPAHNLLRAFCVKSSTDKSKMIALPRRIHNRPHTEMQLISKALHLSLDTRRPKRLQLKPY
ncbi:unnamed protein product [Arctia plantaginis]|uniref:Uncharacterized protein n=1 Tax=Arctia plantaginis TaxID=874455 RepID=A0A8S1AGM5_ARCPL|nr:unnamed protein product [Arctia plantaginis]